MTSKRISDQIQTIRAATEKAGVSREAAMAFLQSAGIISKKRAGTGKALKSTAIVKVEIVTGQRVTASAVPSKSSAVRPVPSRARFTAKKSK